MARRGLRACVKVVLRRALLLPPVAISILIFLWTASAFLPFTVSRVCVLGDRTAVYFFSRVGMEMKQVSSGVAEVKIRTLPLNLEGLEAGGILAKPALDVRTIGIHQQALETVDTIKENVLSDIVEKGPRKFQNSSEVGDSHRQILIKSEELIAADDVARVMENLRSSALMRVNLSEVELSDLNSGRGRNPSCEGKKVYIYDLPPKFNVDLLAKCDRMIPWFNMCDYFSNSGMGKVIEAQEAGDPATHVLVPAGRWHETHQYSLEIIFHARLKENPCLVASPEEANVFFIPFYGGLDVLRWHFVKNASSGQRDGLGLELIRWLQEQSWWRKNDGIDHVLVLGKVSWDFHRYRAVDGWGNNLLEQPEMQQLTKVLIERHPWHPNDVGVPHPTFFHPRTAGDIRLWQGHIDGTRRQHLVSFAGQPHPNQLESIRSHLIRQCLVNPSSCFFLSCTHDICLMPNTTMNLFSHSEFCLQPPGDSPTRRSIFDSLIAGCIPVLFDPYSAYFQYPWHLPANASLYSVYVPTKDVREGKVDVVKELEKIPRAVRREMRVRIIYEIMPGLVYSRPGGRLRDVEDAFDITLRSLFARVANRLEKRKILVTT